MVGSEGKNVTELGSVFAAGLPGPVGVMLVEVPAGSAAARQGLVIPDVILALNGKPPKTSTPWNCTTTACRRDGPSS